MLSELETSIEFIEGTHGLRDSVLDMLHDDDLKVSLGGSTLTLGELLREWGEVQYSYVQSFREFKQDWDWRTDDPAHSTHLDAIRQWYAHLDSELIEAMSQLSEGELAGVIERGFEMPTRLQIDVYLQAVLIFLGKASIYLRVLNKPLGEKLIAWVG